MRWEDTGHREIPMDTVPMLGGAAENGLGIQWDTAHRGVGISVSWCIPGVPGDLRPARTLLSPAVELVEPLPVEPPQVLALASKVLPLLHLAPCHADRQTRLDGASGTRVQRGPSRKF